MTRESKSNAVHEKELLGRVARRYGRAINSIYAPSTDPTMHSAALLETERSEFLDIGVRSGPEESHLDAVVLLRRSNATSCTPASYRYYRSCTVVKCPGAKPVKNVNDTDQASSPYQFLDSHIERHGRPRTNES
jgi:hypothetical protein